MWIILDGFRKNYIVKEERTQGEKNYAWKISGVEESLYTVVIG